MRKVTKIFSERRWHFHPAWQIVYEWEDIIATKCKLNITVDNPLYNKVFRRFEKNNLVNLYHKLCLKRDIELMFVMNARIDKSCRHGKNSIPVIIDYWLDDCDISEFFEAYKFVPLMLITNREVYDILKSKHPPFPIEHWALSYPDKYELTEESIFDKEFEFTLIGRPNPFFIRLLDEYCMKHPDFTYIKNNDNIHDRKFINHKGEIVADGNSRNSYLDMIKKTKISCYTTPGLDESKLDSNRFNQVTPRLFELLCNGCQVIGHYPIAADTEWYELPNIIQNVDNYKQFECVLDKMRTTSFDKKSVIEFMKRHYTSVRALELKKILGKYNICLP